MIKSIRLQNFFSFKDCTINLNPGANVLVGINGSGKSNFFKAIELLIVGRSSEIENLVLSDWHGRDDVTHFSSVSNPISTFGIEFDDSIGYKLNLDLRSHHFIDSEETLSTTEGDIAFRNRSPIILLPTNSPTIDTKTLEVILNVRDKLETLSFYKQIDTGYGSTLKEPVPFRMSKRLSADASNLPHILNHLNTIDKSAFSLIEEAMQKVNENFIKIDLVPILDKLTFGITEKNFNKTVLAYNLSDGTLRFLCLMAILYNPNRGSVVCIDEPELGLHPDMINTLYRAIKHASETSQVIISTHSDHLLNYFNLDEVRVFEKDEHNATVVEQFSEEDFKGWKDNFLVGSMWRSGMIGGNRW